MTNTTMATDRTTSTELATLDQVTQNKIFDVVVAGKAANTLRAYKSDMRQVANYLFETDHKKIVQQIKGDLHIVSPLSAAVVAAYLVERAEQGTALTSLQRHVASISKWHETKLTDNPGWANPCKTQLVRDTVAGLRKLNMRMPVKAKALTIGQLSVVVQGLDLDTVRGLRDRAIILLGWCGALRRSEIANLKWSQIRYEPEGLIVAIMQAKTDTVGEGQTVALPYQPNPQLCPVLAVIEWSKACGTPTNTDQTVFCRVGHNDNRVQVALSGQAVGNIIAACANRVGLQGYTGHSLRAGLATAAILAGRPEHEVMTTTRHKSQAVFRGYVRNAEPFNKAASRGLLS